MTAGKLVNVELPLPTGSTNVWPDPASCWHTSLGESTRGYVTPDGTFPGVTGVLKVLGIGSERLIAWNAKQEREAVLEAATDIYAEDEHDGSPQDFIDAVTKRLGDIKAGVRAMRKAADIGSEVHAAINAAIRRQMAAPAPEAPLTTDAARMGFNAFKGWWSAAGYKPIVTEQPVWSTALRAAGTVDLVVDSPDGWVLVDFKTSRYVYESHHIQAAAYKRMVEERTDHRIVRAEIVKIPKDAADEFKVVPLGKLYDRELSEAQLLASFEACVLLWEHFCGEAA